MAENIARGRHRAVTRWSCDARNSAASRRVDAQAIQWERSLVVGPVPGEVQDAVGTQYVLERELGRGGMATVYLAHDVKHGRRGGNKGVHPPPAGSIGVDR